METNNTTNPTLMQGDILSVKEVLLLMPPSITQGWLYAHWEELGGVTIANKKLILKENLYAYIKGEKREVLCESLERQGSVHTGKSGNATDQLDDKSRGKSCGSGTSKIDKYPVVDHCNDFGLADYV
jgi:hypothetical protein